MKKIIPEMLSFIQRKGSFTKRKIKELYERFREGQSIYKISRNMKRNEKSIKKYLINVGLIKKKICSESLINAGLYNPKLSFKIFFKAFFVLITFMMIVEPRINILEICLHILYYILN